MTRTIRRRSRGFTLIELMISASLFLLIAGGAMLLVMSGNRSQSYAAHLDIAQSSLRAGFDFMSRDIVSTSAGASSGVIYDSGAQINTAGVLGPIVVTDSSTGPDSIELWLIDGSHTANVLSSFAAGSTTIVVDDGSAFAAATSSAPIYAQLSDLSAAVLVRVNGVTSTTIGSIVCPTLTLMTAPGTLPPTVASYATGSFVFKSRHVKYAIDSTTFASAEASAKDPMLTLQVIDGSGSLPQPLAEGIEDMQIALGYDTNGDGVITEVGAGGGDDEWLYNVAGDSVAGALSSNLKAVRVTLIATDTQREQGNYPGRPAAEDHAAGAVDGFPRRVLRTEITVRNFNL